MSDEWETYGCYIDDAYSVVSVDVGADPNELSEAFPTLMRLRAVYKSSDARGMPSETDLDVLQRLGNTLRTSLESDQAHCVGWLTSEGRRDHFLYGDDDALKGIWSRMNEEFQSLQMGWALADEPDWRTYRNLLYPNRIDWQVIWNRKTAAKLRSRGDDAQVERRIENFAWFTTRSEREAFIEDVQALEVNFEFRRIEEDEQFGVEFSFVSELDIGRIDELTTHFVRLAAEEGGEYDGWGCAVTK